MMIAERIISNAQKAALWTPPPDLMKGLCMTSTGRVVDRVQKTPFLIKENLPACLADRGARSSVRASPAGEVLKFKVKRITPVLEPCAHEEVPPCGHRLGLECGAW